jgi:EmrB/QacA subfamily drug resistance transporter
MAFIDGTVVNVALPALQESLSATVLDVQWVVEAYALFLAALLLVGGSVGDRFGRRRIFTTGVILFSLASAWCGFAPGVGQLIAARALQGVGGALLVPGSLAIISASFDEARRGQAIGTWAGFTSITAAVGPVLGGWLVQHVSWRSVFFINLPVGLVVLLISFWRVPESRDSKGDAKLDWLGAGLAPLALGALTYGLIDSSRVGFGEPAIFIALGGGLVLLAMFIAVEARSPNPILPLSLFKSRDFAGESADVLLCSAGRIISCPAELIRCKVSPTAAGALCCLSFCHVCIVAMGGRTVKKRGAKLPLVIGPVIAAFCLVIHCSSP